MKRIILTTQPIHKVSGRRGFTIAEMLVAMGVFLTFTTVALGIYASTLRAQRKTVALSRTQREAQYLMELIAKQIRTSTIDYAGYGGSITSPTITLRLRNQSNQTVVFSYNGAARTISLAVAGGPTRMISSNTITVNNLNFYITPATTPFPGGGVTPTGQPRVSVVMDIQSSQAGQTDQLVLQQTIPQQTAEF